MSLEQQELEEEVIEDEMLDETELLDEHEEDDDEEDDEIYSLPSNASILQSTDVGRVFIVSTARCIEGHRPAVTLQGDLYEVCVDQDQGAFLRRVIASSSGIEEGPSPLSLSLRYEPPSPKFSRLHPALTSYRVKLVQGSTNQFIYMHRGLPKVCLVDRSARCLTWGELQLVMRDTQQLNSVLSVLRHADVQHVTVWPPQIAMLWLGRATEDQQAEMDEVEEKAWQASRLLKQPTASSKDSQPTSMLKSIYQALNSPAVGAGLTFACVALAAFIAYRRYRSA